MAKLFNQRGKAVLISGYENDQRRKTLNVILWTIAAASVPIGFVDLYYGFPAAALTIFGLTAVCLVALRLNKKGAYDAAATLVSAMLFFVIIYDILDAGGLGRDLGIVAFPLAIIVWGLFLGKRGLAIFTCLSIVAVGVIGLIDLTHADALPVQDVLGDLITALILLALTAIFLWVVLDNTEKNLEKIKNDDAGVRSSYELTLEGLVKTLELRDLDTEHHSRRVVALSLKLAEALKLGEEDCLAIGRGALLHDIGKLGVPDAILLKQGPLDEAEWVEMRKHPEHARAILANIPFLQPCLSIPCCHHERWDGAGYPRGLKGEEIPFQARLFAVVDQWEALTSDRVYRKAWPREIALAHIRDNAGKIYDPRIAAVFLDAIDAFEAAAEVDALPSSPKNGPDEPARSPGRLNKNDAGDFWRRADAYFGGPGTNSPFDDEQRRKTLNVILWVTFIGSFGLGWVNFLNAGATPDVWVILGLSLVCLPAIAINIKRYFNAGAVCVALLTLLAAGMDLYTHGGLHDAGAVAFPVIIAVAGLFFGKRGLLVFTLLSAASVYAMWYLGISGRLPPFPVASEIRTVVALIIFMLIVSIFFWTILDHGEQTGQRIKKKETELRESYDLTLEGFARAFEFRGREPEGHSQRVTELSIRLAKTLGMRENELEAVRRGALLHDIGTLFIPDRIMLKPGRLNAEEWAVMKKHPGQARDMLAGIPYLSSCLAIPYCHHEYWDGSGYPRGLKGEAIPLAARLFTLVDHWEELSSDRPFRPAWPPEKVLEYMLANSGKLYDPALTARFIEMMAPTAGQAVDGQADRAFQDPPESIEEELTGSLAAPRL